MSLYFDSEKFRELILYVAAESENDPRFGATKLNKILYFADFKAFGMFGESITGATYQRLDRGPAPRELLPILRQMEAEGDISTSYRRYYNYPQTVVKAERAPDVEAYLTEAEKELVDTVLRDLRDLNASEVSALSHLEAGWQMAGDRDVIPYETAYISNRRPTPRELATWKRDVRERSGGAASA